MARTRRLRLPMAIAAATGAALWIATPAFAHIHTDPTEVQAGTTATVGFIVEHGCADSPTTKLEIQLPDGATDIAGVDGDGFTTSVDGQVVTFSGGPLDPSTEKTFEVSFTAPTQAGDVPVKIVQTCEQGSIDWIEVAPEGQPEPEHPAPVLTITEGTTSGTTEPDHHAETTATTEADHHAETTETTEADHHAETTETTEADHHAEASDESSSSNSVPIIVGVIAAIALVGGGAALYARSRRTGDGSGDRDDEGSAEP